MRLAIATNARLAMTYFGEDRPAASWTGSFMLPEVSYTMATATPSSSAAQAGVAWAPSTASRIGTVMDSRSFMFRLSATPNGREQLILSDAFMRCQRMQERVTPCSYNPPRGLYRCALMSGARDHASARM